MNRFLIAAALAVFAVGSAFPQSKGDDQKSPPAKSAPPQRDTQPQRQAPPPRRDTQPERQAPPRRDTQPQRQVPPQRDTQPERQAPPPRRDTQPGRQAPPQRDTQPERQVPPQRDTQPERQAPPPQRDTQPQRQAPPTRDAQPDRTYPTRNTAPARKDVVDRNFKPSPSVRLDNGPAFQPRTGGTRSKSDNNFNGNNGNGHIGPDLRPTNTIIPHFSTANGNNFNPRVGEGNEFLNRLRWGYYNRDPRWRDYHFGYGYYCYRPIPYQCGFSPYYWYWCVPGYLPWNRCHVLRPTIIIIIGGFVNWNYCGIGSTYGFYSSSYNNYTALDRSISDLRDAFIYRDYNSLGRLVPNGGRVEIFIDGQYVYSLDADDYYDITADLIYTTETTDFEIVDVRKIQGNRGYVVTARHEFIDSWGQGQHTYLTFTLQRSNGGYVITQAGTGRSLR